MPRQRRLRAVAGHLLPPRRPSPAPAAETAQADPDGGNSSWVPTSGLFFEDYDILPRLTNDMAVAKSDLDRFGYCLWRDAIDAEHVGRLCRRIVQQAEAEQREGLVKDPEAAAHFMSCVINKGEEFWPLLTHPEATELLSHLLGEHYNLSTGFVKIVKPGAEAEALHTDRAPTATPPPPTPPCPILLATCSGSGSDRCRLRQSGGSPLLRSTSEAQQRRRPSPRSAPAQSRASWPRRQPCTPAPTSCCWTAGMGFGGRSA